MMLIYLFQNQDNKQACVYAQKCVEIFQSD